MQLDRCARLDVEVRLSSYRACGGMGLLVSAALLWLLRRHGGGTVALLLLPTGLLSFLCAVKLSHVLFGYERVVFYEKSLAVLLASALVLQGCGLPVAAGLDLALLGLGAFLALGRIGCLMVGCCHGRPARWGIAYGVEHVRAGLPAYYLGARLLPIQALEAMISLFLTAAGVAVLLRCHRPGAAAALYAVGYALWRFAAELLRGDDARPYLLGLSEAQWTALLTTLVVAALGRAGWVHAPLAPAAAAVLLAAAAVLVLCRRRLETTPWGLRAPRHVAELARAIADLRAGTAGPLCVARTAHGICLTYSEDRHGERHVEHYGVSSSRGGLSARSAQALAELIALLRGGVAVLVPSRSGAMFHVMLWRG